MTNFKANLITMTTSCYVNGSEMPHHWCPLPNDTEYINCGQAWVYPSSWACTSMILKCLLLWGIQYICMTQSIYLVVYKPTDTTTPACKELEWWGANVVISLERGADLHMAQLMPLPLTVSCFSKIQIGFTFLVPAHPGSPRKRAVK